MVTLLRKLAFLVLATFSRVVRRFIFAPSVQEHDHEVPPLALSMALIIMKENLASNESYVMPSYSIRNEMRITTYVNPASFKIRS